MIPRAVGHASPLAEADPELAALVAAELGRQRRVLDMVASENFVPRSVLEAQGSVLTNKYADGYPGRREYDGCEVVDEVEALAVRRARSLFGAEHANLQPYSGSNANAAVLQALCRPGDTVLGFDFSHGGHPTHYDPETFAGRFYNGLAYHVRRDDYLIDTDEVVALAEAHRPRVIFAGWSCYFRPIDFAFFRAVADDVGAYFVCDMAHFAGLVAAHLYPDPVPFAHACTLTVHKTLGGARGGAILCTAELAERIDAGVFPGDQGGPLMHVIAGKAATLHHAAQPEFAERMARTIAGARTVAAAFADGSGGGPAVLTGGTDVHLLCLDTSPLRISAAEALERLHAVSVTANAMRIAYDPAPQPAASGLRLGTAALSTRGFGGGEFEALGAILLAALRGPGRAERAELARRVEELSGQFPLYPWC